MSATEIIHSERNAQYVATIAQRDLQIEELKKEVARLRLLLNSIRFGSKSERQRSAEDDRQPSLFSAVELPAATPQPPLHSRWSKR